MPVNQNTQIQNRSGLIDHHTRSGAHLKLQTPRRKTFLRLCFFAERIDRPANVFQFLRHGFLLITHDFFQAQRGGLQFVKTTAEEIF